MRYPAFLQPNDTIGLVAPSFGANTEPYRSSVLHAMDVFREKGYQVLPGPNAFEGAGIGISNTPEKCGQELTDFYTREDTDVLLSVGGGELMCEDLPYVDFEKIRTSRPKWYMGYSDNTNFTFLLNTLCDTAALYAPCVSSFGMEPWDPSIQDAYDLLTGKKLSFHGYDMWEKDSLKDAEHPLEPYNLTEKTIIRKENWDGSPLHGRLLGGCMDVLVNLTGTRFDRVPEFVEKYKSDGILWFLEACDLNVFSIRRALFQMREAGWFQYTKGFLFGRPLCMGQEMMGLNQYEAVLAPLKEFDVPILMDLDIGHFDPMLPIMSGAIATIVPEDDNIRISFELK